MGEGVGEGEIRFALHSLNPHDPEDKEVDAGVFARKLATLVRALQAADAALNNGQVAHTYTIAKLHTSTPTAILRERPIRPIGALGSGIDGFIDCAASITVGANDNALRYGSCAANIVRLSSGAEKRFGYGEVDTADREVRVDPFLQERAIAVIEPEKAAKRAEAASNWFKGAVHASFVGSVKEADLRGKLPAIKLILSAGGRTIDCVCRDIGVEEIRSALDRRVRISGRAIYDGKGGLPRRIEVRSIERMGEPDDFERWKGAFEPFVASDWDGADA